jgi:hypothetical protein
MISKILDDFKLGKITLQVAEAQIEAVMNMFKNSPTITQTVDDKNSLVTLEVYGEEAELTLTHNIKLVKLITPLLVKNLENDQVKDSLTSANVINVNLE